MSKLTEDSRLRTRSGRKTGIIVLLVGTLVVSNVFWLYVVFDAAITATYHEDNFRTHRKALITALAILPVAARPESTRDDVVSAALAAHDGEITFEKEGFLWVGGLGLRFDEDGRLVEAVPSWSPF
jgi:hypothetical protein